MSRKKRNELKAGIFVAAAIALLLVVVIWIGAADLFAHPSAHAVLYCNISDGALGLVVGADVFLGDLRIGKITAIHPDVSQGRIFYDIDIYDKAYTLYSDGKATIGGSLIGSRWLAVTDFGHTDKGLANQEHPVGIGGGLDQALNKLSGVVDRELDEKNPDSLLSKIKGMAGKLDGASGDIASIAKNLRPEMDPKHEGTFAYNLKVTSKNLAETTTKVRGYAKKDLGDIMAGIKIAAENLRTATDKVRTLFVANSEGLDEMVDNMVAVSANLKAASTEIRRNPWRLFYKPDEKKMRSVNLYDAARAFDEGATQLNAALTKLSALREMKPTDPAAQEEIKRVQKSLEDTFTKFKKVEETLWKEVSQ